MHAPQIFSLYTSSFSCSDICMSSVYIRYFLNISFDKISPEKKLNYLIIFYWKKISKLFMTKNTEIVKDFN